MTLCACECSTVLIFVEEEWGLEFLCVVLNIPYSDVVLLVQFCTPFYSLDNFVLIDVFNFAWSVVWFWYSVLEQYNVMFWCDFVL